MGYKKPLIKKAVFTLVVGMAFLIFSCQTGQKMVRSERPLPGYSGAVTDYEAGRYERALKTFDGLLRDQPDHPEALMIRYYQAFCHYYIGDFKNSIALATEWLKEYPDNPERYKVQKLAGDANRASGHMYDACFWMIAALRTAKETGVSQYFQEMISDSIADVIGQSNEADLEKIKQLDSISPFFPSIYLREAEIALEKGTYHQARRFANLSIQSASEYEQPQLIKKGRELLSRIIKVIDENSEINRKVIGCLLPIQGDYSLYGEELLNGIQLGMDMFSTSNTGESIDLVIKNTSGSPEDTLAAVDDLIFKDKVIAIIGPLASSASVAAVKKAQAYGVPIITFTQKQNITDEGDMVFRNYLTPSREMDVLLQKVFIGMGMTRFGIFYPNTSYGNYFMNLFWDKVEELGGEITAVESYRAGETDFAEGIKKMVGLYYPRPDSVTEMLKMKKMEDAGLLPEDTENPDIQTEPESTENPEKEKPAGAPDTIESPLTKNSPTDEMTAETGDAEAQTDVSPDAEQPDEAVIEEEAKTDPIIDFDAVFIPDNSQDVALIAPQFPFYNVFNVPFLGTSLWLSNELISTTSDYLQGAIFPVGFYMNDDSEKVRKFVGLYRDAYGKDPGILAATGYDTIKMIKEMMMEDDITTRTDFQKALEEFNDYTGVTGQISFDKRGEVEKSPMLLTVHGRRLHILH